MSGIDPTKILAEREGIFFLYNQFLQIPSERKEFEDRVERVALNEIKDVGILIWILTRVKKRLDESKALITEALASGRGDLRGKELVKLSFENYEKEGSYPVQYLDLRDNYLDELTPKLRDAPFLTAFEADPNIKKEWNDYHRDNQGSFDFLWLFRSFAATLPLGPIRAKYEEILGRRGYLPVIALAREVGELDFSLVSVLESHPLSIGDGRAGGLRTYFDLSRFGSLERIDFSGSSLERYPPEGWLGSCMRLTHVNLADTPIASLPSGLRGKPLVELSISGTHIRHLPEWIGECDSLRVLKFAGTPIGSLPPSIARLRLEILDMSQTSITDISKLSPTGRIILNGAAIREVPRIFISSLRAGTVEIDATNHIGLRVQKVIACRMQSPFLVEKLKRGFMWRHSREALMPVQVRSLIMGLSLILLIGYFYTEYNIARCRRMALRSPAVEREEQARRSYDIAMRLFKKI